MSNPRYLDKILTKEILEQSYTELGSLRAVARKFNIDPSSIKKYMNYYNLELKKTRYNVDHNFFSYDNEESFYVAGFIAADGCIKNRNCFELSIGLSNKDREFLEKIKQVMNAENPIKDYIVRNSKRNSIWKDSYKSEMTIVSKQICQDLKRFNIVPRKSLIYTFPEWMKNHPFKHHFIRGYNDGDGCFYLVKKQLYFSMRGTVDFLTDIRSILEEECDLIKRESLIRISSGHGCLEYGGNIIINKIVNYLYNDATIYLARKYEIAKRI
jgi:hypothetical protein